MTDKTTEIEQIKIETDVLVIGGGPAGMKAASDISDAGYSVILTANKIDTENTALMTGLDTTDQKSLAGITDKVLANKNIEVLDDTSLVRASGATGEFTVRLAQAGGSTFTDRKIGAVVVATDYNIEPLNEKYGLELSETIITQSDIEKLASEPEKLKGKTIAFLVGYGQEGNPLVMERVFRSVDSILDAKDCAVYVYVNNLKLTADGLDRIYKSGRDKGAIYIKSTQIPAVDKDGKTISFHDPVIRKDVELLPDLIVVEEAFRADKASIDRAEILRIFQGPESFLQKDNVHFFPAGSNRDGIYVVGAGRAVMSLPDAFTDIENAVLEIKNLLGDGTKTVPKNKAVVDPGKCVICLTCYRSCPHGAIYWEEDHAVVSPVACQGCGTCASECPMDAIQVGGFEDTLFNEEIKSNISNNGKLDILAFCCQNSAFEAGTMAKKFEMGVPGNLSMIKVPCAGKIDLDYIMGAFAEGADGVLVMTCHPGNCKSEWGNTYAGWRVNDAYRLLEDTGIEKERLCFATIASNMGSEFSSIVKEMEEKINKIGKSPVK